MIRVLLGGSKWILLAHVTALRTLTCAAPEGYATFHTIILYYVRNKHAHVIANSSTYDVFVLCLFVVHGRRRVLLFIVSVKNAKHICNSKRVIYHDLKKKIAWWHVEYNCCAFSRWERDGKEFNKSRCQRQWRLFMKEEDEKNPREMLLTPPPHSRKPLHQPLHISPTHRPLNRPLQRSAGEVAQHLTWDSLSIRVSLAGENLGTVPWEINGTLLYLWQYFRRLHNGNCSTLLREPAIIFWTDSA